MNTFTLLFHIEELPVKKLMLPRTVKIKSRYATSQKMVALILRSLEVGHLSLPSSTCRIRCSTLKIDQLLHGNRVLFMDRIMLILMPAEDSVSSKRTLSHVKFFQPQDVSHKCLIFKAFQIYHFFSTPVRKTRHQEFQILSTQSSGGLL